MELTPLCQPLETASHISLFNTPYQVLITNQLLLQAWYIQVLLQDYHNLILCTSITFLTNFITH